MGACRCARGLAHLARVGGVGHGGQSARAAVVAAPFVCASLVRSRPCGDVPRSLAGARLRPWQFVTTKGTDPDNA